MPPAFTVKSKRANSRSMAPMVSEASARAWCSRVSLTNPLKPGNAIMPRKATIARAVRTGMSLLNPPSLLMFVSPVL